MGATRGSVDQDYGPDAVPQWGGRNRERRNRPARPIIDLTESPKQRRTIAKWTINGYGSDAAFFNLIRDALLPVLAQRNTEEHQARTARQALRYADAIVIERHAHLGYSFCWTWRCLTFYLAIREDDQLTQKLDRQQPHLDHLLRTNDKVG